MHNTSRGLQLLVGAARWHRLMAAVTCAAAVALGGASASASGKLCAACIHDVGLATFYTHSGSQPCKGQPIDPVNVVFWDYLATGPIANEAVTDLSAYSFPLPPPYVTPEWFTVPSTDPQSIKDLAGNCPTEAVDVGTDGSISSNRYHMRLFNTATQSFHFAVGDAHQDLDPSGYGTNCHGSKSFDAPKQDIVKWWKQASQPARYEFWGNTRHLYQSCLGYSTWNSGYVAALKATPSPA